MSAPTSTYTKSSFPFNIIEPITKTTNIWEKLIPANIASLPKNSLLKIYIRHFNNLHSVPEDLHVIPLKEPVVRPALKFLEAARHSPPPKTVPIDESDR